MIICLCSNIDKEKSRVRGVPLQLLGGLKGRKATAQGKAERAAASLDVALGSKKRIRIEALKVAE